MRNPVLLLATIAAGAWLISGCSPSEPATTSPGLPPPPLDFAPAEETSVLPPGITPEPVVSTGDPATDQIIGFLGPRGLFEDEEGRLITKSSLAVMQRAAEVYEERRFTYDDPAPPLTDFSLLVKYQILRALPPAPPGKKFVLDAKDQRVSLVNQ
jgi:hypothetical protein